MAQFMINQAESMEMQLIQAIDNFVNAHASFIFVYNGAQSGHKFGYNMIDITYPCIMMIYCGYVVFDVTHRAMCMQFWRRAIRLDKSNALIVRNTLLRDDHEIINNLMFMGVAHTFIMLNMWIIFMCGDGHGSLKEVYVSACVAYAMCWGAGVIYGYVIKYLTFGTLNVPKKFRNRDRNNPGDENAEQNNQELFDDDNHDEDVEERQEADKASSNETSNAKSTFITSQASSQDNNAQNVSTISERMFSDESIQKLNTLYSESQD